MTNFSSLAALGGLRGTQYKLRYEQSSCRLELTGLPDVTAAGSDTAPSQRLDILTSWELNLGQRASLEGRREHLEALVQAVLPYVRLLVSNQPCPSADAAAVVSLEPRGDLHHLVLRSSQPDTPPLELDLDHAELADLNHCLDQMLGDARMAMALPHQAPQPLRRGDYRRHTLQRRGQWLSPLVAMGGVALAGVLLSLMPLPPQTPQPTTAGETEPSSKPLESQP